MSNNNSSKWGSEKGKSGSGMSEKDQSINEINDQINSEDNERGRNSDLLGQDQRQRSASGKKGGMSFFGQQNNSKAS